MSSQNSEAEARFMGNFKEFLVFTETLMSEPKGNSEEELMFTYKGVLYPSMVCSPEMLQAVHGFEVREDDLLVVCYPKCGTNWAIQLMKDMVYTIRNKEPSAEIPVLEFGTEDKLERLSNIPSPRVVFSHLHRDHLPKSVFENKVKTLVVLRNPKDAAVSFFHFYNSTPVMPSFNSWDEFFVCFMSGKVSHGSYFDHAVAWNKHIDDENVMIIMYEEMKKDLDAAVQQIADFFGINLAEEEKKCIVDRASFKSMKEKSTETHGAMGPIIFRKGEVGDWKNHFSEVQSQEMDAKFEECLAGTKLGARMMYGVYCQA